MKINLNNPVISFHYNTLNGGIPAIQIQNLINNISCLKLVNNRLQQSFNVLQTDFQVTLSFIPEHATLGGVIIGIHFIKLI